MTHQSSSPRGGQPGSSAAPVEADPDSERPPVAENLNGQSTSSGGNGGQAGQEGQPSVSS